MFPFAIDTVECPLLKKQRKKARKPDRKVLVIN